MNTVKNIFELADGIGMGIQIVIILPMKSYTLWHLRSFPCTDVLGLNSLYFLLNVKFLALLYHLALTLSKVTLSLYCVKILEKNSSLTYYVRKSMCNLHDNLAASLSVHCDRNFQI